MRKFESKQALAHLKWKLINQDGLSPQEAEVHIQKMIDFQNKFDAKKKQEKKIVKPNNFKEEFEKLKQRSRYG